MSNNFFRHTSANPYLHERMTALEDEQRDRLLLRYAALGPVTGPRRSLRRRVATSLRAWADRLEVPARVETPSTVASWDWAWDDLVTELGRAAAGGQSSATPARSEVLQGCECEPGR